MIVQVKEISIRHNGIRYVKGEDFEIERAQHERIKNHVTVVDDRDPVKSVDEMTVAELKKYAAENEFDLGDASKKDEILQVIFQQEQADGGKPEED